MEKNVKNNVTRIVLSVLILALIPVMHLLATERPMSYEEYFSQERELIKTHVTTVNENWIDEPFIITETVIDYVKEQYPQQSEQIIVGNVYQEQICENEEVLTLIATGNFSMCESAQKTMYSIQGSKLQKWNLATLESETIFTGTESLENLRVFDEVVFFSEGDNVYRYHVSSDRVEFLVEISSLNLVIPVSNCVVGLGTVNEDYYEILELFGPDLNDYPEDPEALAQHLNARYDWEIPTDSSILNDCTIENILMSCGIEDLNVCYYNSDTQQFYDEYTPNFYQGSFGVASSETRSAGSGVVLSPYPNPQTDYHNPNGHVYISHRAGGCAHHNGCSYLVSCDCINIDGGIQCNAYVRHLLLKNTDTCFNEQLAHTSNLPSPSNTAETKQAILSYGFPLVIEAVPNLSQISHYIYVYYANNSGVLFCEANTNRAVQHLEGINSLCLVNNYQMASYSDLSAWFTSFVRFLTFPNHTTHNTVWKHNGLQHWRECIICCKIVSNKVAHVFSYDGTCSCGYTRPASFALLTPPVNNKELNSYK